MTALEDQPATYTAFSGHRKLASGPLPEVAAAARRVSDAGALLIYTDDTGREIDLDLRGTEEDVIARYSTVAPETPRGRGRPKLGVVGREVTLLPRHWEWLDAQPGGASVTLRKLVEEARRANRQRDRERDRRDAAYRFMSSIAGDFPGFEEAARALYAGDRSRFTEFVAAWPADVRDYATALAFDVT